MRGWIFYYLWSHGWTSEFAGHPRRPPDPTDRRGGPHRRLRPASTAYSKDHRPDLRQMILAVLIDGDGSNTQLWNQ